MQTARSSIRWGILGTGNIAGQFARGLRHSPGADLVAVGSRTIEKARRFGGEFGSPRCHGSYESLVEDRNVDVVYIATPHPLHFENLLLCLNAGKAVLCEKPLCINEKQAREATALAERKQLFLMEAMWTRFLPPIAAARKWIEEGTIGEPRIVSADFGFRAKFDAGGRLFNAELGGGCLLDIGVYPIFLATMILGAPDEIAGYADIGQTGVDEQNSIALAHPGGRLASLYASIRTDTPNRASLIGTRGRIDLHANWWKGGPVQLMTDGRTRDVDIPVQGNGYQYEADEVARCLRGGKIQSDAMPWDLSLRMVHIMDRLRSLWRLKYPME